MTAPRDGELARLLQLAAAGRIGGTAGREGTAFGIGRTRVCTAHSHGFPRRGRYHVTYVISLVDRYPRSKPPNLTDTPR